MNITPGYMDFFLSGTECEIFNIEYELLLAVQRV